MLGTYYYHEIVRKTIISFGTLFNDIHVRHHGALVRLLRRRVLRAQGPVVGREDVLKVTSIIPRGVRA